MRPGKQHHYSGRHRRGLIALAAVALVCGAGLLAACGKETGTDPVVSVGHHVITRDRLDHWISVLVGRIDGGREPSPPSPIPPDYKACKAYEATYGPRAKARPPLTHKQIDAACDLEYRRYKLKALYLLITRAWVIGEAAELGVKLDRAELNKQFAAFKHYLGPSEAAFHRYLRAIRANASDMYLSLELEQLIRKTEAKIGPHALARFGQEFKRKWTARTDCRPGYVVPVCRQYKAPKTPPQLIPPNLPFTGAELPAERVD